MRVLFAHGFEGGPDGSKPTFMREVLGWDVVSPVMSDLGWSIENQTEVLVRLIDSEQYDLVIGSSMGGLAAANASEMRGDANFKLLLIAPAFGLCDTWENLTDDELESWEETGVRRYSGFELNIDLGWNFMEDARRMSWPTIRHKTTIIHGSKDVIVPLDVSQRVSEDSELVDLVVIDDGHRMKNCLSYLDRIADSLMSS
tara:strand:- start:2304 stop:2903 length:600 start_codon:yes stop_codon:yes gene_type:complete